MNDYIEDFQKIVAEKRPSLPQGSIDIKLPALPAWTTEFRSILADIKQELNACYSTLSSISHAYAMVSREEALKLTFEDRDKLKEALSLLLRQVDVQITNAISLWVDNFENEFYSIIHVPEDVVWESYFKKKENEMDLSLLIQQIDFRLWLYSSALQTLIIKYRSISCFFAVANYLRAAREKEINAPKREAKPIQSPQLPKFSSIASPVDIKQNIDGFDASNPPKCNVKFNSIETENNSLSIGDATSPSHTQTQAFERSIDVHQEELTEIQHTHTQLETIATLQTMLTEHLEVQSMSVDTIFDEAHMSLGHVGRGLECLQQANANPEGPFKMGAIFLVCLSACLLLYDFIN